MVEFKACGRIEVSEGHRCKSHISVLGANTLSSKNKSK